MAVLLLVGLLVNAPLPAQAPAASAENWRPGRPLVGDWGRGTAVYQPVPLTNVRLGGFLGKRVDANNRRSLLAGLESPIPAAFDARAAGREPPKACRRLATDSDMYKWLEGACYAIAYEPSLDRLAERVQHYADLLVAMQEPDGYLGTRLSPAEPFDTRVWHDLYVAGHFIEAAVAHHRATGRRELLDAAGRLADFYIRAWRERHPYFATVGEREHPEIEPALVRLYRATGEQRYLEFAEAVTAMSRLGPTLAEVHAGGGAQHAVRLCYLLTGAAELQLQGRPQPPREHVLALWNEILDTRMYVTGGIGYNEVILPEPYDLPHTLEGNPHRDIAETCASVSLMMLSWRMHTLTGDSRAFDAIETILYNHYLGAIAHDHLGNFYYNPLRRVGDMTGRTDHGADPVQRQRLPQIHSTTCCLPNSWRFFAQLPEYAFSVNGPTVYLNLYTEATAHIRLPEGADVRIEVRTDYPHDGAIRVRVEPDRPVRLMVCLRIPAWCDAPTIRVAGDPPQPATPGRYHEVYRQWQPGDELLLDLPMPPRVIVDRPEVAANRGQVAFGRGPLIYCLEKQDAAGLDLAEIAVRLDPDDPVRSVRAAADPDLGLHVLKVQAHARGEAAASREVTLVPFYFRANREPDTRWITFIPHSLHPAHHR